MTTGGLSGAIQWLYGFLTFIPWSLLEKIITPDLKNFLLNMTARLKAKQIRNDIHAPYRCVENLNGLVRTIYDDKKTMDGVFQHSAKKHAHLPCLGTRELLSEEDEIQPDGKVFKKATFGEYKWETFQKVYDRVLNFSRGLPTTGQKPKEKLALFLETRAEWMIAIQIDKFEGHRLNGIENARKHLYCFNLLLFAIFNLEIQRRAACSSVTAAPSACFRDNFPVVTVYATLGEDGIEHALSETEVTHVITSATLLNSKLKNCLHKLPLVTKVIYVEDCKLKSDLNVPDTVQLLAFAEVEKLGTSEEAKKYERVVPQPDDLAIVMYTSGQSGDPKGVLINHSNMVSAMSGMTQRVPELGTSDVYIGYLPLAHVLELAAENCMLARGARIGYSSPLTLSDRSSRIKKGSQGDASVLQPTLMAAVPEILERMRKAVMQNVNEMSSARRTAFHWAYGYKLKQVERGYSTPILDRLIFQKTRALLGGRVRAMLSGGAPMNVETQRFMNVCMCCPLVQGYGLTETCGATSVSQVLKDFTTGRVGPPLACSEVKIVEWEDGGYSPKNKPYPQGEIHVGGPNITQGYFKKPEKTAENFYVDQNGQRWFKTGDIGQVETDGALRIIDRKKDLVKLSHGEYIALGSIEAKLKASPLIDNVWIYANSTQAYALAFIIPNELAVRNLATSKGVTATELSDICKDHAIVKELKTAVADTAKLTKLQKFEIPQKIHIDSKPWLPEDGLITAAFKLKRKALENYYRDDIKALYV